MELSLLKLSRFLVPPGILLVFWSMLGAFTGLWRFQAPDDLTDIKNLGIVIPGAIYYALPLREWSNRLFFDDVSENLRSGLVRISGIPDNGAVLTWKAVRGIFYSLVDNDASLSTKAKLAYWNGLFWTSAADLRALSCIFVVLSALASTTAGDRGWVGAGVFFALLVFSFPLSWLLTRQQKAIGNQQIEIIEHNHREGLRAKLEKVLERASS